MCFISSPRLLFKTFFIYKYSASYAQGAYRKTRGSSCKVSDIVVQFSRNKSSPVRDFMKIPLAILELLHANRETDVTELVGAIFETLLLANIQVRKLILVTPYHFQSRVILFSFGMLCVTLDICSISLCGGSFGLLYGIFV